MKHKRKKKKKLKNTQSGKKKIVTVLGRGFWRLLFLSLEFFTFMRMYVLGLIELELSLKLWI